MRAVIVHNAYRDAQPSGETQVVEDDVAELRSDGVEVATYFRSSDEIDGMGALRKLELSIRPTVSASDRHAFRRLLADFRPDVVHFHNVFPLLSPALVHTARTAGALTVQTVHNYRHSCPSGVWFRDGRSCQECVGRRVPVPAVWHRCYGNSVGASAAMALATTVHKGTWRSVNKFLPVSNAVAQGLAAIGVPQSRILVRPNRVQLPNAITPVPTDGPVAFIGRLEVEKGVVMLLDSWSVVGPALDRELVIAGAGTLDALVAARAAQNRHVRFVGRLDEHGVHRVVEDSSLVVLPSIWPEPDPLVLVNALGAGRPVLATRCGSMPETLGPDAGWLADPTTEALTATLHEALSHPAELQRRSARARERALGRARSYARLSQVYSRLSHE